MTFTGILLLIWANIATVAALAGLVALWWAWPRLSLAGLPIAALVASSAFLGALGWGEQRYIDGRDDATAAAQKAQRAIERKLSDLETDFREQEREHAIQSGVDKKALRDALANAAESDNPDDVLFLKDSLSIANDMLADLDAQNEELRGQIESGEARCVPKIITKTVRASCLKSRVPPEVVEALRKLR